jgi:hypothetical protein
MKNIKVIAVLVIIIGTSFTFYKFKKNNNLLPIGYGYINPQAVSNAHGEIGNFALLDHNGAYHELYRHSDAKAVVFISQGNDCPIIQKSSTIVNELRKHYEPKQIVFYYINSNQQDARTEISKEAKSYGFELPILLDSSQLIAESLGITRTGEAVVVNPNGWKIIYRGAISDRLDYGVDKQKALNNYLADVLDSVVENKSITIKAPPAKGCMISFSNPKSLSYEKTVAPIIQQKCLGCHTENGHFPPFFSDYQKMKGWASMSKETILTDRMPPNSADTYYGNYKDNFTLTPEEKRIIVKWIDAGSPRDGTTDPLKNYKKPVNPESVGKRPIFTTSMDSAMPIAPGGQMEYGYVQLGGPVPYDMWVTGVKVSSTNPRQIHHEAMMITSKPLAFYEKLSKKIFDINEDEIKKNTDGDIVLYTLRAMRRYELKHSPGTYFRVQVWGAGKPQPFFFGNNNAAFIPKGYHLVLENHYMGTGKEETEKTTIEFYGHRQKQKSITQLRAFTLTTTDFEIPPLVKNYKVLTPQWKVTKNIHFTNFLAHLHMRGSSVKLELTTPDGEKKTIYSTPNFNYGWQTGFILNLENPIAIKAGSLLQVICHFDNSPQNPFNPDPSKKIRFGQRVDRTEMCKVNTNYTYDSPDEKITGAFEIVKNPNNQPNDDE